MELRTHKCVFGPCREALLRKTLYLRDGMEEVTPVGDIHEKRIPLGELR